jgi:hypothetical protein
MDLTLGNVTDICNKYEALQNPEEVYDLLRLLVRENIQTAVELGSHRGGMCAALCTFLPCAQVIGVEFRLAAVEASLVDPDMQALRRAEKELGFTALPYDSLDPDTLTKVMDLIGKPGIDFLIADTEHDYKTIDKEFCLWFPVTRFMAFHDIGTGEEREFWLKASKQYPSWEFSYGYGIGLLQHTDLDK